MAGKFHTCGLRSIFRHAQVAAENDLNLFRRGAAKLCEAFWGGVPPLPPCKATDGAGGLHLLFSIL